MSRSQPRAGAYVLSLALAAAAALSPPGASAAPDFEPVWDEPTKLRLGHALLGEADKLPFAADHAGISHVLLKRWKTFRKVNTKQTTTFREFVRMYSAFIRSVQKRSRTIQALPWGPAGGPWGARWERVRRFVELFAAGRVRDPCPRALHWGGKMDAPKYGWTVVSCGATQNFFYAPETLKPVKVALW